MNIISQNIYIPDAFSPNGDGINDVFIPIFNDILKVKYYNLEIYDRFGVLVFQSNDPDVAWVGLPFDTIYIYRFYMECEGFIGAVIKTGSITSIN